MRRVLVDAGPIFAYLHSKDQHHDWARAQFERFAQFVTCDAVLAEVCARLAYYRQPQTLALQLLQDGAVRLDFALPQHHSRVAALMKKYADRPMDLADACLVVMTEMEGDTLLVTCDKSDFAAYRRNGRELIPILTP
jgi:predicted nucleic acid-binding protein